MRKTSLEEFIKVLAEIFRTERQQEADGQIIISRDASSLRELHEPLLIIGGYMEHNKMMYRQILSSTMLVQSPLEDDIFVLCVRT